MKHRHHQKEPIWKKVFINKFHFLLLHNSFNVNSLSCFSVSNIIKQFNNIFNYNRVLYMLTPVLFFLFLQKTEAQTISATDGTPNCGDCAPTGWIDLNGTPDISNSMTAALTGQAGAGGGATWVSQLPLPPNNHNNWLSLRDLGTGGIEERLTTNLSGLTIGQEYEVIVYSLTTLSNADGDNANGTNAGVYAGVLIDEFFADIAGVTFPLVPTEDVWNTGRIRFTATAINQGLILRPGNNGGFTATPATVPLLETVQVSITLNAVNPVPVAVNDSATTTVNTDVILPNIDGNDTDNGAVVEGTIDLDPSTPGQQTSFSSTNGSWTVNGSGDVTFSPNSGFVGIESIPYTIQDNYTLDGNPLPATSETANLSVNIPAINNDNDGDGIFDDVDIDDDNDGILDIDEQNCPSSTFINLGQTFTQASTGTATDSAASGSVSNLYSFNGINATFAYQVTNSATWSSGVASVGSTMGIDGNYINVQPKNTSFPAGSFYPADAASTSVAVYTITFSQPVYSVEFKWGGIDINDRVQFIGELNGTNTPLNITNNNLPNGSFTITGQTVNSTSSDSNSPNNSVIVSSSGPLNQIIIAAGKSIPPTGPGNVTMQLFELKYCFVSDTDGDSIPNHLDLDSDNDGIPDIVEAGGTDTDGNGTVDNVNADGTLSDDTDGDGLADVYDTTAGGSAITNPDTDGDGIPDAQDLDSDNDGIVDVVEAGGIDADRDGKADNFTDADNDGFNDAVDGDTNNDGTADNTANALIVTGPDSNNNGVPDSLPNGDADNDGILNQLDIDADNDGIPDNVEAQTSAGYTAPTGVGTNITDANNNGVDDNYEDGTNIGVAPVNTDATNDTIPDYLDTDADNDGILDIVENGDSANNNITNINADADGDGLNDIFDDNAGFIVNDGLGNGDTVTDATSLEDAFNDANNDFPGAGDLDYRDSENDDNDGDSIPDNVDLDDDNDGIPDVDENSACSSATLVSQSGVIDPNNVLGEPDGQFAQINVNGNEFVLDFGRVYPAGTEYRITWRKRDGENGTAIMVIGESEVNSNFTTHPNLPETNQVLSFQTDVITANIAFRYLRITKTDPPSITDFQVDAIVVSCDSDNDGIPNQFDLDSDNDGIPDIVEAGGTDTDGNGTVDNVNADGTLTDDTDRNGLADLYDTTEGGTAITNPDTDGDGIPDAQDLDSDNDGIVDVVEAGGIDADRDGEADNFTDADNDGFNDTVDGNTNNDGTADNTANALIVTGPDSNNDGVPDSLPNGDADNDGILNHLDIDADNDGIPDNVEAQTTNDYTPPSGVASGITDTNNNGVDDNYEDGTIIGINPENTDGTDNPDYLDTDADNDGILDIAENGDSANNNITDINADADGDGLNDIFDDNVGFIVNDGLGNGDTVTDATSLEDAFNDADNDFPGAGDLDYRDITDTDGDGIADNVDLDDDNDGIPDAVETVCNASSATRLVFIVDDSGSISDAERASLTISLQKLADDLEVRGNVEIAVVQYGGPNVSARFGSHTFAIVSGYTSNPTIALPNNSSLNFDHLPESIDQMIDDGIFDDGGQLANPSGFFIFTDAERSFSIGINAVSALVDEGGADSPEALNDFGEYQRLSSLYNASISAFQANDIDQDSDGIQQAGGIYIRDNTFDIPDVSIDALGAAIFNNSACDLNDNDSDNDGIPNSLDLDSDNDGIPDIVEAGGTDTDGNGTVDNVNADGTLTDDTDGDGLADVYDTTEGGNAITNPDTDGDGIPDALDLDSDNDGIPDIIEAGATDADRDGKADNFTDADNDGFNDAVDGDTNNDGTADNTANALIVTGPDSNNDGVPNSLPNGDEDNDGILNHLDIDADNDGIPDNVEGQTSAGYTAPSGVGTGITDANNNGVDDNYEDGTNIGAAPVNTDVANDTIPDYLDDDSDNDGILDINENGDTDAFSATDIDGDGLVDAFDDNDDSGIAGATVNDGLSPTAPTVTDATTLEEAYNDADGDFNPGAGDLDFRDSENNDNDGDGVPDDVDLDDDNDGIPDTEEGQCTATVIPGANGFSATEVNSVGRPEDAIDGANDNSASLFENGSILQVTLRSGSAPVQAGTNIAIISEIFDVDSRNVMTITESTDGINFVNPQDVTFSAQNVFITTNYTLTTNATDIRITYTEFSSNLNIDNVSYASSTEECNTSSDTDRDGIPDFLDLDSDNDGIPDLVEAGGTDTDGNGTVDNVNADGTLSDDTDGDGLADVYDTTEGGTAIANPDTDGDGIPDALDLDADNDGIPDVVEAGGTDANGDGKADNFVDADNDGFNDVVDGDTNNDGTADNTANALIVTGADTDNDGQPNSFPNGDTDNDGILDSKDLDSDNDGLTDLVEAGGIDTNGDGLVDTTTDVDQDGLADIYDENASDGPGGNGTDGIALVETDASGNILDGDGNSIDTDGDGFPNHLDLDSDNDGIPDLVEAGGIDTNGDGLVDDTTDADNDGLADIYDTDDDGVPGVEDATDALLQTDGTDTDNDGKADDAAITFENGEGINADTDGDGFPDHLDLDADNDGIPDLVEAGGVDTNGDGLVDNTTDADNDGLADIYDTDDDGTPGVEDATDALLQTGGTDTDNDGKADDVAITFENGEAINADTDGDGFPDHLDLDADNDGIPDLVEAGGIDTNGDGLVDDTTDADNDGLADIYDTDDDGTSGVEDPTDALLQTGGTDTDNDGKADDVAITFENGEGINADTDGDAFPDHLDLDADNDGIPDLVEAGGIDTNGDGLVDNTTDADNDGLSDIYDTDDDGIPGVEDANDALLQTGGTDTDGDGKADDAAITFINGEAINADTDGDGLPDHLDLDSDNDGIVDLVEAGGLDADRNGLVDDTTDADNDGLADIYDSDDDGTPGAEDATDALLQTGGTDADNDGKSDDAAVTFVDGNGVSADTDGDGLPNHLDIDADNDGIPDNVEGQTSTGYIAPSGVGNGITDTNNNGVDDNYENGAIVGLNPVNTDRTDNPDYIDTDADNDGILDINENGDGDTFNGTDTDGDGLVDVFDDNDDTAIEGSTVNDGLSPTATTVTDATSLENAFNDADNDFPGTGDLDYRDSAISEDIMITQVYQFGTERWIEITNISTTNTVAANTIHVQLYEGKSGDQTGVTPDASTIIPSAIAPGQSVLFRDGNTVSRDITNTVAANTTTTATVIENNALTNITGGDDIITVSSSGDATSWANRFDVVSEFSDNTSLVRIDETLVPNRTYTASEWVTFIDDAIPIFGAPSTPANAGRHPHAPLVSEIIGSNNDANTLLGLHRIDVTTRTGGSWNNGIPDRSRFVIVDEDFNQTSETLSARKLTVNDTRKLGITNNLLVVTNDVVIDGEIRLIDVSGDSRSQLIQTHKSASLVTADSDGLFLVDQNSTVPSLFRYNYIGSPVTSSSGAAVYTVADILKDGTNPTSFNGIVGGAGNTGIAKNITYVGGFDGDTTDPISLADYWMYSFAPASGGRANWIQKRSTGTLANADGFIFKGPGRPQNYTFAGIPKDGTLTAPIGASESYLIANPYASAISVKEFIEDNLDAITGVLYFWEHVSEQDTSGDTSGHNFAGYIGGYATRTIATGVSAINAAGSGGPVNRIIQAENATISNGSIKNIIDGATNIDVAELITSNASISFRAITSSVETLVIRYRAAAVININILENGSLLEDPNNPGNTTFTLPATGSAFSFFTLNECVVAGSDIRIVLLNNENLEIDYLNIVDTDGQVACAPNVGNSGDFTYTAPESYIAIGQGFFVGGDTDGGTITFDNSQREYVTEGAGNSVFLKSNVKTNKIAKSSQENVDLLPVIKLGMDFKDTRDDRYYHRQIAVSFSSFTSFAYDKGYDAEMFDIGATDFYWKFPNLDQNFVIAGVQPISNELEVPMEIRMSYSGDVVLMIDELKDFNDDLFIIDKVTGESYNIKENSASISLEPGTYTNRFFLAFKSQNEVLSIEENLIRSATTTYLDNQNKNVVITKQQEIIINNVQLYNLLGKKVTSWNITEQKEKYELKINKKLPTGVYIIRMNTNKGASNKKVVVE
ncbi:T9SS type A sorting domain-containing protein [uncultured Polaribacter sp.]|uniref:T9SS type A sorting domain-containing protein n=1 Tax=uncultured Polaribacter sp. TaxID=174711 RepID=UPI0026343218|nr:T9SS type A sorting domain-containing protein [uncultured Polaribacter sp.]